MKLIRSVLHRFRSVRIRPERRADLRQVFPPLACSLICWRYVARFCQAFKCACAGRKKGTPRSPFLLRQLQAIISAYFFLRFGTTFTLPRFLTAFSLPVPALALMRARLEVALMRARLDAAL